MIIRQLNCSLLFIAIGPAPQRPQTAASINSANASAVTSRNVTPTPYHTHPSINPQSPPANSSNSHLLLPEQISDGPSGGSGSSIRTMDTGSTAVGIASSMNILQRQAEELAKWLDAELANFEFSSS